ncbi:MAG: M24 family metallopeptidase [Candidatus Pacearchaeota archaeon]
MKFLQEKLITEGLDGALFFSSENADPNLFYLTRYSSSGYLYVPAIGVPTLIVHQMNEGLAKGIKGVNLFVAKSKLSENLVDLTKSNKKVGLVFESVSHDHFIFFKEKLGVEFVNISKLMQEIRSIKNAEEIALIQKACKITDSIFEEFTQEFSKFKTEQQAVAWLTYQARLQSEGISFEPIVATGKNAAVPHHTSNDVIRKGLCVVDYGVKWKGYCSDVTRTFSVGKPSSMDISRYNGVLSVQEECISKLKSGVSCSSLHNYAQERLGKLLNHNIGHGLGIEVHESPAMSGLSSDIFKKNMVVTLEPGAYVLGKYGVRIEDDFLVRDGKTLSLSKFTKDLIKI